ncbi:Peptidase M12A [Trinorchestia longiramus]|nr:Peptidase M12A [Trinorchestia longiramus]
MIYIAGGIAEKVSPASLIISSFEGQVPLSTAEGKRENGFKTTKRKKRNVQVDENELENNAEFEFSPIYSELSPHVWERLNEIVDFGPTMSSGRQWPGGRVPYVFAEEFDLLPLEKLLIKWTMKNIESKSCVKFVPRTAERDYVNIIYDSYKCYSSVGRVGGEQPLSLGMFCSLFWDRGNIYHELLHALGFYHEHTRPDRDHHVLVKWDNIKAGMEVNFRKDSRWAPEMLQMPYDVESVMHYSSQAFSKMYLMFPTIVTREGGVILTRPRQPSELDYAKLNRLYDCPKYSSRRARLNSRRLRKGREVKRRSRMIYNPQLSAYLEPPPPSSSREIKNIVTVDQTFNEPWRRHSSYRASNPIKRIDSPAEPWGYSNQYKPVGFSVGSPVFLSEESHKKSLYSNFYPYFNPYATTDDLNSNVKEHSSQSYHSTYEDYPSNQMNFQDEEARIWSSNYVNVGGRDSNPQEYVLYSPSILELFPQLTFTAETHA